MGAGRIPPSNRASSLDIRLRCMDTRYMSAAERYITRLDKEISPYLITRGGPILMIQIENEYVEVLPMTGIS